MAQYSFPVLSTAEVLGYLSEMDIPLQEAQLTKPTYDIVKAVYETFVCLLTGATREEMQQPVFMAIDTLEFPELHDESIPAMAFIKHLNKLMLAAGIKDFTLKDLYKPEAQRLRRNLSGIINFAKFREEKLTAYAELQDELEALSNEQVEMEQLEQQLRSELASLQADRNAQQPQVAAVEAEIQTLHQENQGLAKEQAALTNEVRALKQKTNQLTDAAAAEKLKLSNIQQDCQRMRGQIVQSPEKLQASLSRLAQEVETERELMADAERKTRELQAKMDSIAKVERELQKSIKGLEELEGDIATKKGASRRVKALKEQIAANEQEVTQLTATQQHLQRSQASLVERLHRLENQAALRQQAIESQMNEKLRDKEAIQAENAAAAAKIKENHAIVRSTRQKMEAVQTGHQSKVNYVMEQYDLLKQQVTQYHEQLDAVMQQHPVKAAVAQA